MAGPRVPDNAFTERAGVIAVDLAAVEARCVWRETSTRDVGIDGQIEHVSSEGVATGRIVAVQVKSGESYFADATATHVPYSPSEAHRVYWESHPIPVILALHHPGENKTFWMDARAQLCAMVARFMYLSRSSSTRQVCSRRWLRMARCLPSRNTWGGSSTR